jgi:hypothetical protein
MKPVQPSNVIAHTPISKHHKKPESSDSVSHSSGIKAGKRRAGNEPLNPPVVKRKAAPASLFITSNKKPNVPGGDKNGMHPGEKKESVRERLARQMVFYTESDC